MMDNVRRRDRRWYLSSVSTLTLEEEAGKKAMQEGMWTVNGCHTIGLSQNRHGEREDVEKGTRISKRCLRHLSFTRGWQVLSSREEAVVRLCVSACLWRAFIYALNTLSSFVAVGRVWWIWRGWTCVTCGDQESRRCWGSSRSWRPTIQRLWGGCLSWGLPEFSLSSGHWWEAAGGSPHITSFYRPERCFERVFHSLLFLNY